MPPSTRRRVLSIAGGIGFVLMPWLTAGLGTPVAYLAAAFVMGSRLLGVVTLGFGAAWIVAFANAGAEDGSTGDVVFTAGMMTNWVGGGVLAAVLALPFARALRDRPAGSAAPASAPPTSLTEQMTSQVADATRTELAQDPTLRRALRARTRRKLAREILHNDPELATDLAIGRPDLGRDFKDGGLVDVNGAPAAVLADLPGFDHAMAEQVVTARDRYGSLTSGAELVVYADIPNQAVAKVEDRLIFRSP